MAENTNNSAVTETEETTAAFTTETNSGAGTGTSTIAPGYGTGRRKEAVARVRLVPGTGEWKINGRTLEEYFPSKLLQREVNSPIVLLKLEGKFDAIVLVDGGGTTGQAGAIRLGVARALNAIDRDANRAALKKAGFLTATPASWSVRRPVCTRLAALRSSRSVKRYTRRRPPCNAGRPSCFSEGVESMAAGSGRGLGSPLTRSGAPIAAAGLCSAPGRSTRSMGRHWGNLQPERCLRA